MASSKVDTRLATTFALGNSGKIVSISEVDPNARYALGPFKCVGCDCELIPSKGKFRAHHFKHHGHRPKDCSDETYLHSLAKTVLYETIQDALVSGTAYPIMFPRPLLCDRYKSKYDFECRSEYQQEKWDVSRAFDTVELETSHGGFVPDVLLSNSDTDEVIFLEIKVTHECEEEKKGSGFRIIEIEVSDIHDIERLRLGKSLSDENTTTYGLKAVEPRNSRCRRPCSAVGVGFFVFESGKSLVVSERFEKLDRMRERPSTKYFKYLGSDQEIIRDHSRKVFFKNSVEAKFDEGVEVRSCLLCKKGGFGRYEKPIFCFAHGIETGINDAFSCKDFTPVSSKAEAQKRFKRNTENLNRLYLGPASQIADNWLTGDDRDLLED